MKIENSNDYAVTIVGKSRLDVEFLLISDLHLLIVGQNLHGLDHRSWLDACIRDINANHSDAVFCILMGDHVDDGAIES